MANAKRAVSQPVSLPAPTGGWNARDSLTGMSPLDAVTLTNWYPATTECQLRKGYAQWATGISGQVQTVMAYSGGSTEKLFAINASGSVYDVTATGAVGAAVLTGLSNGKWGYLNIATAGGNSVGAIKSASSGVVQVLAPNSVEVSDYGQYDTSKIDKEIMVTVKATFEIK